MEHKSTFTFRVRDVANANGTPNTIVTGGYAPSSNSCGVHAHKFPALTAESPSSSTSSSASSDEKSPVSEDRPKRKRDHSETLENERPAKRHYIPAREVVMKNGDKLVTLHFEGYNNPNVDDADKLSDVDADIYDLVKRDPEACYDHPWTNMPGLVEYLLENSIFEETVGIHNDTEECLYALAEAYADGEGFTEDSDSEELSEELSE
ncbi:hypothetical protein F5Y13DRAFT_152520 [Hypoxylon sp. FL1857]|nr:hypothetical protein F5Y13DRAFT_152520 [Hypoxylon sp. FL1857]